MAAIEDKQGELTPELEARLDEAVQAIVRKQDGYIMAMDIFGTYEAQAKKWRDYMAERVRYIQNQQERLKSALIRHLHTMGLTELRGELGKVKLMKTVKVGLILEDQLPAKYKEIIQEIRIDKRALLEDLKSGPVDGAEIEQVEYVKVY